MTTASAEKAENFHSSYSLPPPPELKVKGYSWDMPHRLSPSVMPPHAVCMQSASNPPRAAGAQRRLPEDKVISSFQAAFAQVEAPPLSTRSPAVMLRGVLHHTMCISRALGDEISL
jgi:hypothetical protein